MTETQTILNLEIPAIVIDSVKRAIAHIKSYNAEIKRGAALDLNFCGEGRYEWDSHLSHAQKLNDAIALIEKFRAIAEGNGIDHKTALTRLSYEAPTTLSDSAKLWI
jgi:hypothetical protein